MAEKESVNSQNLDSDSGDGEFEPTAEMMVNDFDDERTLDEEEALEEKESQNDEIANLTKEQDMPIEELLAIYGAYPPKEEEEMEVDKENGEVEEEIQDSPKDECIGVEEEVASDESPEIPNSRSSSDENMNNTDNNKESKMEEVRIDRRKKEKTSDLVQLYPELDTNGDSDKSASARALRSAGSRQQSEEEDEEGEEASGEEEEDWRKTIMIGSSYQAQVPEGLHAYGDTPPYENEDRLLWEPGIVSPDQVENYLSTFSRRSKSCQGVASLPLGSHVRDDEYALHLLLQCGYNVEEALRRQKMNPSKPVSQMTLWSEEECRNFENGLKTYGKDFHLIQQNKVRTRSVGELVQFYYLWKKTERHDMFATKTRIEKKKYIVHPGTTDYMDRFLDEGEGTSSSLSTAYPRDPPGVHSLLYGRYPPAPGIAPPITPSTVASATIALVAAGANGEEETNRSHSAAITPTKGPLPHEAPPSTQSTSISSQPSTVNTPTHCQPIRTPPTHQASPNLTSPSLGLESVSLSPKTPSVVHSGLSNGLSPKVETIAL